MSKKTDKVILCQDSIDPDPELLVWEKWIRIRKEETDHLALKTGRSPAELTMNLCEKVRGKKESKTVLERAQIEKKVGVRGTLWDQPERLKQKCYCKPVYELHRTRAEMGRPSIVQHIGVPRHIQETEKGISGFQRKTFEKLDLEYKNYKDKREKDLAVNMKKVDPHRPEMQELIIIGSKPKTPPKKLPPLPTITVSSPTESPDDVLYTVYAVRINNTIFLKDIPHQSVEHLKKLQKAYWHEKCESWSYYFNCPINRIGRSKLFLENLGTVTLRYCWRKSKRSDDSQHQVFFFNKNENVVSPGQSQEVFFTFMSSEAGTYYESWELVFFNIYFFDSLENQLKVNLYADSVEDILKIKKKIQKLENFIYSNVLKNVARDIVTEIIVKATSIKCVIYPYEKMFLEAELFVMKNPVCFYHQTEVMKMKEMYTELVAGEVWDLSISSWRSAMMDKEYDDRMKYYELLKSSHREFLKPWYEENDLFMQKQKAVNEILGQLADKFDEEYTRIPEMFYNVPQEQRQSDISQRQKLLHYANSFIARYIFYIRIYDHLGTAIELCAGILSSLDLNRWIQFDFCKA